MDRRAQRKMLMSFESMEKTGRGKGGKPTKIIKVNHLSKVNINLWYK